MKLIVPKVIHFNLCASTTTLFMELFDKPFKITMTYMPTTFDALFPPAVKTVIFTPPEDQYMDADDTFAVFRCEARSDASTPVLITWEFEDHSLDFYAVSRALQRQGPFLLSLF